MPSPHSIRTMKRTLKPLTAALVALHATQLLAQSSTTETPRDDANAPTKTLGVVVVSGNQPTSLPTQIPTTMEGIDAKQIERYINATDSEDVLKYFPSLLVRKRYVGDYNHAILSTRASGTGNSARSLVFADGIPLSNLLGNGVGGLSFPPRWGLVTPEEIARVDVMYGPFSAAYSGNSVGAVVDYQTRMPTKFEAHVASNVSYQPFDLYNTHGNFTAWQTSASMGSRSGAWSWWLAVNHMDSEGQPLTFATRLVSSGTPGSAGTAVSGAVAERNNAGQPWWVLGSGTQYRTQQDHAKLKVAYDVSPTVRASYTFGLWQNDVDNTPQNYLRNAAGQPVYSGTINIDGRSYAALTGGDFATSQQDSLHTLHGLSIKSNSKSEWDWELAASLYRYDHDRLRQNAAGNTLPAAASGGAGTLADGRGSGWTTVAARATWRPAFAQGAHIVEFGAGQDNYRLRFKTSAISGNWLGDAPGALLSNVEGNTRLLNAWAQDAWTFDPRWKAVLGARIEQWRAQDGVTAFSASSALTYPSRQQTFVSPKAAISFQATPDTVIKASLGRAVRFPTVAELYGATSTTNSQFINDPNLRPERSWTGELSAERDLGQATLRATLFAETTRDALYSQTVLDAVANRNISRVVNVGRIATRGVELAANATDVAIKGLELLGSVTYADSIIKENAGFVATAGDTLGKWQPNIPKWRATALASYRINANWTATLAARYSGTQYRTLNNADINGFTYQGVSRFLTVDARAVWKINRTVTAAIGIDNLGNDKYWNFHPYPQRTYFASLRADF